jgi:hypothetical protein
MEHGLVTAFLRWSSLARGRFVFVWVRSLAAARACGTRVFVWVRSLAAARACGTRVFVWVRSLAAARACGTRVFVWASLQGGCSSSSPSASPKCDPARCPTGNACVDDGSDAGPHCGKVCTRQSDCPFNSYCNDGQPKSWCVPTTIVPPIPKAASGQWGDFCPPNGGENNAACDVADTFGCYGTSPTDANAFCTFFDCAIDSDCKGGWWCAKVNVAPNVATTQSAFGQPVRSVCLPRGYCASCQLDHDCAPAPDGTPQHCVPDSHGNGFCSPKCGMDTNCQLDAVCRPPWAVCTPKPCASDGDCPKAAPAEQCLDGVCQTLCTRDVDCPPSNGVPQHCSPTGTCAPQSCVNDDDCPPTQGTFQHCNAGACTPECSGDGDCNAGVGDQKCAQPLKVCLPRAGVCFGDGGLCSPCHSDADCTDGFCLTAAYSTERFCSKAMKSGTTCSTMGPPAGSCPAPPAGANFKQVACTSAASDFSPANQCVGEVSFGRTSTGQVQFVPGCWTANR